jgi:hypothetical protein
MWAPCFSHSSPQALQTSAHSRSRCMPCWEPRATRRAVRAHTSAQSRSRLMQVTIIFTSCSCRQAVAHHSQAAMQALRAASRSWCWVCMRGRVSGESNPILYPRQRPRFYTLRLLACIIWRCRRRTGPTRRSETGAGAAGAADTASHPAAKPRRPQRTAGLWRAWSHRCTP